MFSTVPKFCTTTVISEMMKCKFCLQTSAFQIETGSNYYVLLCIKGSSMSFNYLFLPLMSPELLCDVCSVTQ